MDWNAKTDCPSEGHQGGVYVCSLRSKIKVCFSVFTLSPHYTHTPSREIGGFWTIDMNSHTNKAYRPEGEEADGKVWEKRRSIDCPRIPSVVQALDNRLPTVRWRNLE
jgi:hypothetical protein